MQNNNIAKILKLGFIINIFDFNLIQRWAEKKINEEHYDDDIAELLFSRNKEKGEVIELLNRLENGSDDKIVKSFFLSLFYQELKNNRKKYWKNIEKKMYELFSIDDLKKDDFILRLNDDYLLRREGFSGNINQPVELFNYLKNENNELLIEEFWKSVMW